MNALVGDHPACRRTTVPANAVPAVRSFTHKIDYLRAAKYVLPRQWRTCPPPERKLRREIKSKFVITKNMRDTEYRSASDCVSWLTRSIAQYNPVLFCSLAVLDPRVSHSMDALTPFISVLCHSDWLFHRESCPHIDVVHPGRAWSLSPACTWHCSLHYLFLQTTPLFPHGVTTVC